MGTSLLPVRRSLVCAVMVLGAACARNRSGTARPGSFPEDGLYDFTAPTGEAAPLRGTLAIVGGVMSLRPEFGTCRIDQAYVSVERTRYLCDNSSDVERLAFLVDALFPLTRSRWTGMVRQRRTRTVCVRYATQNGRQVCVEQRQETVEVETPVSGRLTFRARPAS